MFKYFHEPLYSSNKVIRLQESRQSLFSPRGSVLPPVLRKVNSFEAKSHLSLSSTTSILFSYPALPNTTDSSFQSTWIRGNE